jgi:uncharacterized protein YdeI (YjbR/CyaY-like superfamily)
MAKTDSRVDAYIAKSADFAKPILNHLRELAHTACPEVEETLKWAMPHFLHKGILFGMAAFKRHCMLHFWKGNLILDKAARKSHEGGTWQFDRITALSDLPGDRILLGYIKKAVELNEAGIKKEAPKHKARKELVVPDYFIAVLKKHPKAREAFEKFSYSHKKEYVEWITEAKREETRQKRMQTTIEWLTKGKSRNWKYML